MHEQMSDKQSHEKKHLMTHAIQTYMNISLI